MQGLPLKIRKAGEAFAVDLRINTAGVPLGPFDLRVSFDHTLVTLDGDASINADGSAVSTQLDISVIDAVATSSGLRLFGACTQKANVRSSINSNVRGTWGG